MEEAQALPRPWPWSLGQRVVCEHLGCRGYGDPEWLAAACSPRHPCSSIKFPLTLTDYPEVDIFEGRVCKLRILTSRAVTVKQVSIGMGRWFPSSVPLQCSAHSARAGGQASHSAPLQVLTCPRSRCHSNFSSSLIHTSNESCCLSYNSSTHFLTNVILIASFNPCTFL